MAVLIDTDVLIDVERDEASVDGITNEDCAISVITVSELLHGAHRAAGAVRSRRLAFAEHILASLAVVPISTQVARIHSRIHADLAASGQIVGAHDLWIGATAVAHDLGVVTRNARDFVRISGLRVVTMA